MTVQASPVRTESDDYVRGYQDGEAHGYHRGYSDHRGGPIKFLFRAAIYIMAFCFLIIMATDYKTFDDLIIEAGGAMIKELWMSAKTFYLDLAVSYDWLPS